VTVVADITSITTTDAVAAAAPYKISRVSTKDQATVTYTITEAASTIRYCQLRLGGASRTGGTKLQHLGAVCGLNNLCGESGSRPLGAASPLTITGVVIDDASVVGADGGYTVTAEGLTGTWSS
jgi:hypothetical protein